MSSPPVKVAVVDEDPRDYESKHVHDVYDQIASHFSSTRYKPWPIISQFLSDIPTGWVGLDSGTGNGKYLPLPLEKTGAIWTIGLDRSKNLLAAARNAGVSNLPRDVVCGDVLEKCWRAEVFDYAISIATIHHLATNCRRQQAVERLIESVSRKHGRILIYVWGIEQDSLSKRIVPTQDDRNSLGQDVFVPWILTNAQPNAKQTFHRYYHMFAKDELQGIAEGAAKALGLVVGSKMDCREANLGVEIARIGWERSNYYIELWRWQK